VTRSVIRSATNEDGPAVRAVIASAYAEYSTAVPAALYEPYLAELLDLDARADATELIVAEVHGEIAGAVTFYPDAAAEGLGWPSGWTGIRALAVDPRHRGLGIGDALVETCIERSRRSGATVICLHTATFMRAAVHIYERMGFVRAPEFDVTAADMMDVGGVEGPLVIGYRLDLRP
jgi:predicted N-acetyltransferase YhbS